MAMRKMGMTMMVNVGDAGDGGDRNDGDGD